VIFNVACSGDEDAPIVIPPDGSVATTGGVTGTGGRATGGRPGTTGGRPGTGGRATGGAAVSGGAGGANTGGATGGAGGANTGGANTGGSNTGGAATGGTATDAGTGGANTGGANTGGANTGGANTGGANTGGAATGGTGTDAGTGGASTGGVQNTGGANTGGAATGGAPTTDGGDASVTHKRVFVTKGVFSGDLKTEGAGATGLEGADNLCNDAASAANLTGTYKAWLSTSTVNAIDRMADVGPWHLVTGTKVFDSKAALASNPLVAINVDEDGVTVSGFQVERPWTGTLANGTKDTDTCGNWESTSGSGMCGLATSTSATWTVNQSLPCSVDYSLYCFEQ
jgi:hypothetical protein